MSSMGSIRAGMEVYGADDEHIGTVEGRQGDTIQVGGHQIPAGAIERVDRDAVHLKLAGSALRARTASGAQHDAPAGTRGEEIVIPLAEERLQVEKREGQLGEVQVRKTVEQEQQTVPVELEREAVRVEKRDVGDRPAEGEDLFQEGTIRVPVRGEQAEVTKEAVVTGEVVVGKERTTQRENVSGTVRRERVDVDRDDDRARSGLPELTEQRQAQARPATGQAPAGTLEEAAREPRRSPGTGEDWEQLREQVRGDGDRARDG